MRPLPTHEAGWAQAGMKKADYWDPTFEDMLTLIARLPRIAALIYRHVFRNGDITKLDYVMRQADGLWRVVDILFDGSISRVAVQRSDFRALLASGDPTPLIDSLKKKVVELSNGAMRP